MDFKLSNEQIQFREAVIQFARRELNYELLERDKQGGFSFEGWKKCANFGIQGLPIPKKYGGSEADVLTVICALEGLGYGCRDSGLIFSLNAHMWGCEIPILAFGNEAQKARFLPGLCSGEYIGAHGMTEPGSGSDAFSLQTTVVKKKDKYILNGRKTFITNAPIADIMVVFATVDKSKGMGGITGIIVEKGTPGLSVSREIDKMGLRTSPMGELVFEDCEIPMENQLGKEGEGAAIFNHSMEWERSCIMAGPVGAMQRQIEECIRYARRRQQFGRPIGKFQSVANKIVDMKVRLEVARLLLYKAGWLKELGSLTTMESAIAKLYVSEAYIQSSLDAIQIHGGYGYMTEMEIERGLRDAVGGTLYSGTSEIQRVIISGCLGL
jgi:alkylation response protein AidB-like acyl-CoA dehydrogenase